MILNIIKSIPWYILGALLFAVPSILFIIFLFAGPENNDMFRPDWIINTFMDADGVIAGGQDLAEAAEDFFIMFGWLNLNLLIASTAISLGWSIGSHFLNIDEPGKAKFYGITWVIVSGLCIASLLGINWYCLDSSFFRASQDLSGPNMALMMTLTTIYYGAMYYVSTVLGTARQARSAVLFANKLPARNFL